MQKDDYNKYVRDNLAKTYKRSTVNRVKNINYNSKLLAEKLAIDDRILKNRGNGSLSCQRS